MDKKVILTRAPEKFLPHRTKSMAYMPIGMLLIAASLEEQGISVEVVDGILPDEIRERGDNFFGITFEDIEKRISKIDFDIVGVSAQFTFQWENALSLIRLIKKVKPAAKIVVGGAHCSVQFENLLRDHSEIDVVVRGEGELVMPKVVNALRSGDSLDKVCGVAFRTVDDVVSTKSEFIEDLDSLPLPAYHLIDIERYFELAKDYSTRTHYDFPGCERGMTLITSRGCPFGCVFCSIHLHMGRKWRKNSPEYVLKHIKLLVEKYNVKYLHFEDDNASFDKKRFGDILDGIIDNNWDIRWDTPNGVRADTFDEELLRKCKKSGCTHLILGVESGVQRVLDKVINKAIKLERIEETMLLAKKVGVDTRAFFMIGLPGETKADVKATLDYIVNAMWKYECFGGYAMAVPLYGTKLYDICKEKGYFTREPSIENLAKAFLNDSIIKTEEFSPEYLKSLRGYVQKKVTKVLFRVFLRKIFFSPFMLWYLVQQILTVHPKKWSGIYNRIVFFQHAIEFDMKINRGKN